MIKENEMAGADYKHCEVCGCKGFYDADVSARDEDGYDARVKCLCKSCYEKGYRLVVDDIDVTTEENVNGKV